MICTPTGAQSGNDLVKWEQNTMDQCKHCTMRGNMTGCLETICSQHDSWMVVELRKDTERLRHMMEDGPDGFVHVTKDRHEYATEVATEHGRDEANAADELDGYRRMIDCAMDGGDMDANTHIG